MEEVGRVQRGYFVEGVEGIQFSMPGLTDDLRRKPDPNEPPTLTCLAARDPSNLYGRVIPWPKTGGPTAQPRREAGASLLLIQGEPALWLSPNAHRLITFPQTLEALDHSTIETATKALFEFHRLSKDTLLEEIDGLSAAEHPFANTLEELGGKIHPSGLLFTGMSRNARR